MPYSTFYSLLNDRHFVLLGGGLDKGDFLFSATLHLKIRINQIWVNQIFKICNDYIKNNSNNNLSNGSHIRIAWSCSNAIKIHKVLYITLKKGNWSSSCLTLIKYHNNSLEENNEEEKEPIDIDLTEQKAVLEMMKMQLTLKDLVHKKILL